MQDAAAPPESPVPPPADAAATAAAADGAARIRLRGVRRVLWLTLWLNLLVAAIKAVAGFFSGSTALMADGLHSTFDGVSNVVGLVAVGIAARPPDADHPYGHHKFEIVAALVISFLIGLGMLELGREAWSSFVAERTPRVEPWTFGAALVSLAVSIFVSRYEGRAARALNSEILEADSRHTASDALATIAVLGGLALVAAGVRLGDVLATGFVLVMLGLTVVRLLRRAVDVLMDMSRIPPESVEETARTIPGVISCHAVRSRGMPGHVQVDLHVTLDPAMRLADAGERMLAIKAALRERFPDVRDIVVQVEPHLPQHLERG